MTLEAANCSFNAYFLSPYNINPGINAINISNEGIKK